MPDLYDPNMDYYTVLGLPAPTTTQAVQIAFLARLNALGPPSPETAALREALNTAFYYLSDVVRRAEYDKARAKALNAPPPAEPIVKPPTAGGGAVAPAAAAKRGRITVYEAATPGGIAALEQRLLDFPDDFDTLAFLAFQYYSTQMFDKAAGAYSRYLRQRPEDADAHYYAARTFQRLNQLKFAIVHFRKVVELAPGTERAEKSSEALGDLGA